MSLGGAPDSDVPPFVSACSCLRTSVRLQGVAVTDQSATDTGAQDSVSGGALLSLGQVSRCGIVGPSGSCRFGSFNKLPPVSRGLC